MIVEDAVIVEDANPMLPEVRSQSGIKSRVWRLIQGSLWKNVIVEHATGNILRTGGAHRRRAPSVRGIIIGAWSRGFTPGYPLCASSMRRSG